MPLPPAARLLASHAIIGTKTRVKVAIIFPYSFTAPGGVQSHVAGLAAALRSLGHDVDVLGPADGEVDVPGFRPLGRSTPIRDNGSVVRVALGPGAARRTLELLEDGRYDVVHLHEPMIPAVGLAALLRARAPLVGTFHMHSASLRWYRPFGPLARRAIERLAVRIAVSEAARAHVARVCPGVYRIVPNGVALPPRRLRAGGDGSRFVFVGRDEPRKGLSVLLEAFARLDSGAVLDLVGVWPHELHRRRLPRSLRDRVRALGRLSEREKWETLGAADVLCAPALRGESFGVVLVEGMAAGLPVVASDIPGYRDVLAPHAGLLVPPGDPSALAAALAELRSHGPLRRLLGMAGRREARRYAWTRVAAEVVAAYSDAHHVRPARAA